MIDGPLNSLLGNNNNGSGCGTSLLVYLVVVLALCGLVVLINWLTGA